MKQLLFMLLLLCACQPATHEQANPEVAAEAAVDGAELKWAKETEEVKKASQELLFHVGNHNHQAMVAMSLPDANVGIASLSDGKPKGTSMTLQGYFDLVNDRSTQVPYYEPPHKYSIEISEGRLAFVRAECYLYRFGVKQTFEDDFFTFAKTGEDWQLLSASFTVNRLPDEEQTFNMEAFAKGYAQVWGSTRKEFVALFFADDGSLQVNEAEAAMGREQIAEVAQGFMTDLPDMRVLFDSLVSQENSHTFYWTLIATHAESGNKINVSGYEEWTMSDDNLIQQSLGHFPSELYDDQISNGSAN